MNNKLKHANGNLPLFESEKQTMIEEAAEHYGKYMDALKIDWRNDPNSEDTPMRVAKSFVNDLAKGCYSNEPNITTFENVNGYDGIVFQGNIKVNSFCSHHHLPFIGNSHVAYIPTPKSKIIGLSKLNRTVEFFARRPQVQENLTMQIHDYIHDLCEGNLGVAVVVEASHMCACVRGVKHDATMKTAKLSGVFMDNDNQARTEFYNFIKTL